MRATTGVLIATMVLTAACAVEGLLEDEGGETSGEIDEGEVPDLGEGTTIQSDGPWTVYADPYADGTPNPMDGVQGYVIEERHPDLETTIVILEVTGVARERFWGAHVHRLACNDNKGGSHYQHVAPPAGVPATDPAYANPWNEVWLDFTTGDYGQGGAVSTVPFIIRQGEARAVVVHDHFTDDMGRAGPKLACIDVPF